MRKEQTPAESKLWTYLRTNRANGVGYRRQHAIGPYIADFCVGSKLVIEVDGSQHLEQEEYDADRTEFLREHGYTVLRFSNGDVMNNMQGVMDIILEATSPAGKI